MEATAYLLLFGVYLGVWLLLLGGPFRERRFLSFGVISQLVFGFVFIAVPLLPSYRYLIAQNTFYVLVATAYVSYIAALLLIPGKNYLPTRAPVRITNGVWILLVLLWLGIEMIDLIPMIRDEGLWSFLTRNRLSARLGAGGVGTGRSPAELAGLVLRPVGLIGLLMLVRPRHGKRKSPWMITGFLLYGLFLSIVLLESNHRTPVVTSLGLGVAYVHFYIRRFTVWEVSWLLLGLLGFLAVSIQLRRGLYGDEWLNRGVEWIPTAALSGFATADDFLNLYERIEGGETELEYGRNLVYLNLITLIPRAMWKEKPVTSFNARMTEEVYGYEVGGGAKYPVRTFTIWGEGYAQFGVMGIALYSFLFVGIYRGLFLFLARFEGTEMVGIWFLIKMPQVMRAALDSILVLALFTVVAMFLATRLVHASKRSLNPSEVWKEIVS